MQAACTQPSRHGMGQVAAAANAYDRSGNCIHQEAEVEQDEKGDSPLVGQVEDGSEPVLPLPPQEKSPRDKAAAEREDNTHLFVNRENIKKKIFFKDSDSVRRVNT